MPHCLPEAPKMGLIVDQFTEGNLQVQLVKIGVLIYVEMLCVLQEV